MRQFFKIMFATLLAMIVFTVIGVFVLIGIVTSAASSDKPVVGSKAVLVLNLDKPFKEQHQDNPLDLVFQGSEDDSPSLFELTRLIEHAKSDSSIKGIYIQCAGVKKSERQSSTLKRAANS